MKNDPDFIGVYGNARTRWLMQEECNRYGDLKGLARYIRRLQSKQAIKKRLEEKTNGTETTHPS